MVHLILNERHSAEVISAKSRRQNKLIINVTLYSERI